MRHTPHLFIGIGETSAFFTLRESTLAYAGDGTPYVTSFHHCNLSQDADEAVAKAQEYAERLGLPVETAADRLREEMRNIKRASAEALAERAAAQKANDELVARMNAEWLQRDTDKIRNEHIVSFGRYMDRSIKHLPRDYITWLASLTECTGLLAVLAETVRKDFAHLVFAKPVAGHVGAIGERLTLKLTVTRTRYFDGQFGRTYIVTYLDENARCFVSKGSFSAEVGKELHVKASVKSHDTYAGQDQTVIQRIKEI